MSVIGAAPLRARSSPATYVTIIDPGLKPSLRFHSVGSIGTPLELAGIASGRKWTRRPVADESSRSVKKSFGKGMRHFAAARTSQRSALARSTAGSQEKVLDPRSRSRESCP